MKELITIEDTIIVHNDSENKIDHIPLSLINHERVLMVVCRVSCAFILTTSACYVVSSKQSAMFAQGSKNQELESITKPAKCDFSEFPQARIKHVALGYETSVFVCESGTVYVCGVNARGCMGINRDIESYSTSLPVVVPPELIGNEKCVYAGAAALTVCLVTEMKGSPNTHNLYCAGSNQFGECATGSFSPHQITTFRKVESPLMDNERVESISSGDHSFLIVTKSKRLFVTGYNSSQELSDVRGNINTLTEISRFGRVNSVTSRYYSNAILTADGSLFVSSNFLSQVHGYTDITAKAPSNIRSISAGPSHFFVVDSNNTGYSCSSAGEYVPFIQSKPSTTVELRCSVGSSFAAWYLYERSDQASFMVARMLAYTARQQLCDIQVSSQH